jgi:hypothetical protein
VKALVKNNTIEGRFDYGLLTFLYYPVDKRSISKAQGTATITLMNDGNRMLGYFAFGTDMRNVGTANAYFTHNL